MDFETHDRSIIEDLGEEIAALKAENERLAKECGRLTVLVQDWKINCSHAERALAERAGGGGKQDAIDFLYKHGALTHVAAREAVELLTSNGFEISRRPE